MSGGDAGATPTDRVSSGAGVIAGESQSPVEPGVPRPEDEAATWGSPRGLDTLSRLYRRRFADLDVTTKEAVWTEIVRYLQRYVPRDARVLDIACDRGYFIRNIECAERWATDVRDLAGAVGPDVRFIQSDGLELAEALPSSKFDVVFMSNYLEHLPSSQAVLEQLRIVRGLLAPGGHAIVLQPNIRLIGNRYWDFIDHHTALTAKSLTEAAELAGLKPERLINRFLPYTTKSRIPTAKFLVGLYLRMPFLWPIFGEQSLLVARRPN
jgi:SAM-dependent methyltransferase